MIWLDAVPPLSPLNLKAKRSSEGVVLSWTRPLPVRDGEVPYGYVVYRVGKKEPADVNNPKNIVWIGFDSKETSFTDHGYSKRGKYIYMVTALDRLKNESAPSNKVSIRAK